MITRNFCIVCMLVVLFAVLFSNLVNNTRDYDGVTRLNEMFPQR